MFIESLYIDFSSSQSNFSIQNIVLKCLCKRFFLKHTIIKKEAVVIVVALLFYVHGKHLRSCRDGQLT